MGYIKGHSLSAGYNRSGQQFFDLLNNEKYEYYIHSYFFSLTQSMRGSSFDPNEVLNELANCDTYNIPANLLLNDEISYHNVDRLMIQAMNVCNLKAITLLEPNVAPYVKDKFPNIEIHLSVRYWDWNHSKNPSELFNRHYQLITQYIDVVNISGQASYNDHVIFDLLKYHKIKTKMIVNEGCIIHRSTNFGEFPGYESSDCFCGACNKTCEKVILDYPWMALSIVNIYKETLKFFNYDILKISSRSINNDQLKDLLDYWCSDESTTHIFLPTFSNRCIDIRDKYNTFLEWIKTKSFCTGDCYACKACESYYNKFTKQE